MATKEHEHNGLFYYSQVSHDGNSWTSSWFFRSLAAALTVRNVGTGKTLKADMEAFLDGPDAAMRYYNERVAKMADVAAAESALERAKARHARFQNPDLDPRGNTNNSENAQRVMQEATGSTGEVLHAKAAVARTKQAATIWVSYP